MTIYNAEYHSEYYRKNKEKIYARKRSGRRNPSRARYGTSGLLDNELLPEDAFMFFGKDISEERFRFYMRAIK
ncbi:MAG: hypothetical protein BroJett002_37300 [Candidatus Brocadia sinica]|nr:MAG: hypothetical protein BroJett002_37300 [Candidatus Brocadia sinica]